MAKYKVGDKVRVRKDLDEDTTCYYMDDRADYWYGTEEMVAFAGKVVTIKHLMTSGNKTLYYLCEGFNDNDDFWTDEMFEGLAEETPDTTKFKIGDKVKVVRLVHEWKSKHMGEVFTIDSFNPNGSKTFDEPHYGIREKDRCPYVWLESELELVEEQPIPQVQVNITVNINVDGVKDDYKNACWYCRKGGLVDLYLAGRQATCPCCGRVCNATNALTSEVVENKPPKKSNEPLTTEELEELDGKKVFMVHYDQSMELKT